jgi:hypothetical protein
MKRRVWVLAVGAVILALGPITTTVRSGSCGYSNESLQGDYFCNEVFFVPQAPSCLSRRRPASAPPSSFRQAVPAH